MKRIGISPTYILPEKTDKPDEPSEPTQYARQLWFDALHKVAPHVLEKLRDDVYPVYLKQFGMSEAAHPERLEPPPHVDWDELELLGDLEPQSPHRELEKALRAWGVAFNIDADWIYNQACFLLGCWYVDPKMLSRAGVLELKYVAFGKLPLIECDLQAELVQRLSDPTMYWDTLRETPEEWGHRVSAEVKRSVAKARKYVVDTPEKRNLEHFEWAILRQVCGYSQEGIASALHRERLSVKQALDKTFKLIQLESRKLAAGRPKGNESKDERKARVEAEIRRLLH